MSISRQDWEYEEERLEEVYKLIHNEILKRKSEMKSYRDQIISTRKSMWEEAPGAPSKFEEMVDIQHYLDGLKHEWEKYLFSGKLVDKLERIEASPYFARVDFKEDGCEKAERIYIGISSLIDDKTREIYIYDWRAPISSIFYDYELGHAKYKCLEGDIEGEVSLKRQFKILNSRIEYMFNSSVKIDDEVLQKILSKNVDDKMRNIVTTIQKEQNRIIRDEDNDLLIVQGPAGSGKTSVALHRVAYLLYKYRSSRINSNNIVIFSPNQIFNDYISNVLPELGEENMKQATFAEFARGFVGNSYKMEDFNEQMEYVLSKCDLDEYKIRAEGIRFKSSLAYLKVIQNYLDYLENEGIEFSDVNYRDRVIITGEEIRELFKKDYKALPIIKRLDRIKDRIFSIIEPLRKKRIKDVQNELENSGEHKGEIKAASRVLTAKEFKQIRQRVEEMCSLDAYKAYVRLFEDMGLIDKLWDDNKQTKEFEEIRIMTLGMLRRKILTFEDLPAFLIIKFSLEGTPGNSQIRHVVIDEAQDYSALQYHVLRQMFTNCSFTLLGDINQSIHPFIYFKGYEGVMEVFNVPNSTLLNLNKSYRSTREVFEFSLAMLQGSKDVEAVDRRGEKPKVVELPQGHDGFDTIKKDILNLLERGIKSVAVICKTERQSKTVFDSLKDKVNLSLITKEDDEFKTGVSVIPSYLAKGLEFDAVIVYDAGSKNYFREDERKLFYTICSRALHELRLYYSGELTHFVSSLSKELYEVL